MMKLRHLFGQDAIKLQPLKHKMTDAIRKPLRVGRQPIVLLRIESNSCRDVECVPERFRKLTYLFCQWMASAFVSCREYILESTRLRLCRPKSIRTIHWVRENCREERIADDLKCSCDRAPDTRLNRRNQPQRRRLL